MFGWLFRKLFRLKGAPAPVQAPEPVRLIPIVDLGKRRNRQALVGIENLDPQVGRVISNMQCMSDHEIHGPHKRWSDPI
jgi:hypothetical protein